MSKRANPTLVGLFVVIGIVIAVATVLLLGSGKLFTTRTPYVLYFTESVNGLQKGAPVKFKGVTIGAVDEILLSYTRDADQMQIPVVIHLNANQILDNLAVPLHTSQEAAYVDLVNHLVGKLESDSLVTGRLYIGLRYDRSADARRQQTERNLPYPEIPTEPSTFQAIVNSLEQIDIKGIETRATRLLDKLNTALDEIAFKELTQEALAAIQSVRSKIESTDIDASLKAFNQSMTAAQSALQSIEKTSDQIRALGAKADGELQPLLAGINRTTDQAVQALKGIEATADQLKQLIHSQSPAYLKLMKTLDELNLLARSIRELSDQINRNPRMFLTGKPRPE